MTQREMQDIPVGTIVYNVDYPLKLYTFVGINPEDDNMMITQVRDNKLERWNSIALAHWRTK